MKEDIAPSLTLEKKKRYECLFTLAECAPHWLIPCAPSDSVYQLHDLVQESDEHEGAEGIFPCQLPLSMLMRDMTEKQMRPLLLTHGIKGAVRVSVQDLRKSFLTHTCNNCPSTIALLQSKDLAKRNKTKQTDNLEDEDLPIPNFPPTPASEHFIAQTVSEFVNDCSNLAIEEVGCLCCGRLVNKADSVPRLKIESKLHLLLASQPEIALQERRKSNEPVNEWDGPVIELENNFCCKSCFRALAKNGVPKYALCKGYWIGQVPSELQNLTYAEKMLISRIRSNRHVF
jgi:hypothetical protein